MKFFQKSILSLFLITLGGSLTYASTPITGYLEGENLGLIHMDYTTGVNPGLTDPSYFVGNREDFYIDLDDPQFTGPGMNGNVSTISQSSNPSEQCSSENAMCPWNDFAWSPRIGWISFDGQEIQDSSGMGIVNFPNTYFPQISYSGFVNGFAWGATTGWVALSACSGLNEATCNTLPAICSWNASLSTCQMTAEPVTQNENEWGVYLDLTAQTDVEIADCENKNQVACLAASACSWNGASCEFEGTPRGRFFEGFAWSEHLGWISFEKAATLWSADNTEPELNFDALTGDHFWFSNQTIDGSIDWEDFAQDTETGIDVGQTQLTALLDSSAPDDFAGCYSAPVNGSFTEQGNGIDVIFPDVGLLYSAPHGFCKYSLTGEIVNGDGLSFYIGDPLNTLPGDVKADPQQYREAITFYTFAGDYVPENSTLTDDSPALADGNETITMTFTPKDLAGNPIVPVRVGQEVNISGGNIVFEADENNWMRDVELEYSFDNNSYFDTVNPTQTPGNAPVVLSSTDPVNSGTTYAAGTDGTYPSGGQSTLLPTNNTYLLRAISFAPVFNTFVVNQIDMRVKTAELPALTNLVSATPASEVDFTVDENSTLSLNNPMNVSFIFDSPLSVSQAGLSDENMVIGQPVEFSYNLSNEGAEDIDDLAIDHEFNFFNVGGGGFGEEVLELRNIRFLAGIEDNAVGQTDLASGRSRYAIVTPTTSGLNSDLSDTVFFNSSINHHDTPYSFESDLSGTPSPLDVEGKYSVEGSFYGLADDPQIDRADSLPGSVPFLKIGNTAHPIISLTPVQIGGLGFSQSVEFELAHFYLAYRLSNRPIGFTEFAVYEEANPISNIEVRNIGLNTSGLVSGDQIFESAASGRTLSTLSTSASLGLQKEIRRNVANLTRNKTPCPANTTLGDLVSTADTCIFVDEINKTVVAYYQGVTGDLLTLEGATGNLLIPNDFSYTIIVEGGASVLIKSNLVYGNQNSSFGLIVFDDENAMGGNVYLSPEPTNMVGLLYAEGSLLSSRDGTTLYYGDSGDATDLKNQLYWQGKIASKNTLGGGPNLVFPAGIDCDNTLETLECAQLYDLDYLRRFTTINTPQGDYTLNNGKFSGDGICNDALPECSPGTLPSTITLNGNDLIEVGDSKSVDPVYIEPDSRRIPLGFSKEIEFTQGSVVR